MSNPTAKKVKAGIIQDLSTVKKGDAGLIQRIAADWGVSEAVVHHMQTRKRQEIAMLREGAAEQSLLLSAVARDEMLKKLTDPEAMKETPFRDLAQGHERLVNSAVTALEGHQAKVSVDIKGVMEMQKLLAEDDTRMKRVKGNVIPQV